MTRILIAVCELGPNARFGLDIHGVWGRCLKLSSIQRCSTQMRSPSGLKAMDQQREICRLKRDAGTSSQPRSGNAQSMQLSEYAVIIATVRCISRHVSVAGKLVFRRKRRSLSVFLAAGPGRTP